MNPRDRAVAQVRPSRAGVGRGAARFRDHPRSIIGGAQRHGHAEGGAAGRRRDEMSKHLLVAMGGALAVLLLIAGIPDRASADGGGGGGGGGGGSEMPAKPEDRDYTAAVKAIDAGNFGAAIPLLEGVVARDGNNA